MDLSRRSLFMLGAVGAGTVGLTAGASPARATSAPGVPVGAGESSGPGAGSGGAVSPTSYDQEGRRRNPANQLGCPLGKGV